MLKAKVIRYRRPTEDEQQCAEGVVCYLQDQGSMVLGIEITVFDHTIGYAGTFDLWDIDPEGNGWILDWKTSKGIYTIHAVQQVA